MKDYKFDEELSEGIILSRPNRFIMEVEAGGSIIKCHCPSTGRIGGIHFENVPCLISKGRGGKRKTECTVEAISLDPPECRKKSWIGINQGRANEYVGFFLGNGLLPEIVKKGVDVKREKQLGRSRIDFAAGNTYVEVKMPLILR